MTLIEMSVAAGILVIAITVIRSLFLNQLPKMTFPILWCIVMIRLIFPFSFATEYSIFSLQHFGGDAPIYTITLNYQGELPSITSDTNFQDVDAINDTVMGHQSVNHGMELPSLTETTNSRISVLTRMNWLIVIWSAGIVPVATFFIFTYWKLRQKLSTAVLLSTKFTVLLMCMVM